MSLNKFFKKNNFAQEIGTMCLKSWQKNNFVDEEVLTGSLNG